jgi:hypothetical protein
MNCRILSFNQPSPLSILLSATAIPTDHQINDALTGLSHKTASHFAIQQADQITHKYASARQQFCTRAIKVSGLQPASIWSAPGLTAGDGFVIRGQVVEKAGMQAVMINHRGHGNAPEKEKIIGR